MRPSLIPSRRLLPESREWSGRKRGCVSRHDEERGELNTQIKHVVSGHHILAFSRSFCSQMNVYRNEARTKASIRAGLHDTQRKVPGSVSQTQSLLRSPCDLSRPPSPHFRTSSFPSPPSCYTSPDHPSTGNQTKPSPYPRHLTCFPSLSK